MIYFSPPSKLNDPFDCYPNFTLSGTSPERRKILEKLTKQVLKKDIEDATGVDCISLFYVRKVTPVLG